MRLFFGNVGQVDTGQRGGGGLGGGGVDAMIMIDDPHDHGKNQELFLHDQPIDQSVLLLLLLFSCVCNACSFVRPVFTVTSFSSR